VRCRVVIADDYAAMRMLIRATLEDAEGIDIVGEAADGIEAIAAVVQYAPDVLLLDLAMPRVDGLQVLAHLKQENLKTNVVIFSSRSRDRLAPMLLELGASAYVEKGAAPEVLTRAILDAHAA